MYSDDDHGFVLLKHNNAPACVHIALGSSFSCHICWTGPGLKQIKKTQLLYLNTLISHYSSTTFRSEFVSLGQQWEPI